jgi:hypothetical protein
MVSARKIVGLFLLFTFVVFITGMILLNQRRVVSPVPDEGAIRIIYISPTITGRLLPTVTPTP